MRPYLIFWGTQTSIVRATGVDPAYRAFIGVLEAGLAPGFGRLKSPARSEVTIRRPRESDRGWIEDSGDPAFLALLPELVAS